MLKLVVRLLCVRGRQTRQGVHCLFRSEKKASLNSNLTKAELSEHCSLSVECLNLMEKAISKLSLSARAYMRTLRVSRTIADLEGELELLPKHLTEALHYRQRFSAK